jgi:hypothetical protein
MPLAPELDTAGFLTRDPVLWSTAQKVLYNNLSSFAGYPKKIKTFEYPTNASESGSDAVLVGFLNKLQSFLSANVSTVNLTALWASTGPSNTTSDLDELLNITYPILISKEQIDLVRKPFYADYAGESFYTIHSDHNHDYHSLDAFHKSSGDRRFPFLAYSINPS